MAPALRTHPPIHLAPNAKILPAIGIKVTSSSSSPQHNHFKHNKNQVDEEGDDEMVSHRRQ